jgi:uncharacterized protein (DUF302 family)
MTLTSKDLVRPYGFGKVIDRTYEEAVQRTRDVLKEQGFGVLTEIDVKATMNARWTRRLL